MDVRQMTIDEQVAYLMQGTEYGDEELKQAMADELRQRLIEAQKKNAPCASTAASTRAPATCTWGIPSRCASCASSRSWATR